MCPSPVFARQLLYLYPNTNGSFSPYIPTVVGNRTRVGYYGFRGVSLRCPSPSLSSPLL